MKSPRAQSGQVLLVMTGFVCNNNCIMCSVRPKGLRFAPRSTSEIARDLRRGRDQGYTSVEFTGGEPTARPDIAALVSKAKRFGYGEIALGTNARTASSLDFLKDLQTKGLTRITTTVHADCAKVHDAITRVPGSFTQTVQGIKNALLIGITTSVNTVIFRDTVAWLVNTGKFLHALGVRHWTILDLIPDGYAAAAYASLSVPPATLAKRLGALAPVVARFDSVQFMDFPYCMLPPKLLRQARCHFISAKGRTEIISQVGYHPKRFKVARAVYYDVHKARTNACLGCAYRDECGGVWAPYPALYGTGFIQPFRKKVVPEVVRNR